jgi:hypothetical protein
LSNEDSPSQAASDRWVLWNGQTTDDNDHFSVAFDATHFNYFHDSNDSDTYVKWGVRESVDQSDLASCSFRIIAWTLF